MYGWNKKEVHFRDTLCWFAFLLPSITLSRCELGPPCSTITESLTLFPRRGGNVVSVQKWGWLGQLNLSILIWQRPLCEFLLILRSFLHVVLLARLSLILKRVYSAFVTNSRQSVVSNVYDTRTILPFSSLEICQSAHAILARRGALVHWYRTVCCRVTLWNGHGIMEMRYESKIKVLREEYGCRYGSRGTTTTGVGK